MKFIKFSIKTIIILFIITLLFACKYDELFDVIDSNGYLVIKIGDNDSSRKITANPDLYPDIEKILSYNIICTGISVSGSEIVHVKYSEEAKIIPLAPGDWEIKIELLNDSDEPKGVLAEPFMVKIVPNKTTIVSKPIEIKIEGAELCDITGLNDIEWNIYIKDIPVLENNEINLTAYYGIDKKTLGESILEAVKHNGLFKSLNTDNTSIIITSALRQEKPYPIDITYYEPEWPEVTLRNYAIMTDDNESLSKPTSGMIEYVGYHSDDEYIFDGPLFAENYFTRNYPVMIRMVNVDFTTYLNYLNDNFMSYNIIESNPNKCVIAGFIGPKFNYVLEITNSGGTVTFIVKADAAWPSDKAWEKYGLANFPQPAGTGVYSLVEGEYEGTGSEPSQAEKEKYPIKIEINNVNSSAYKTAFKDNYLDLNGYNYSEDGNWFIVTGITGTGAVEGKQYILEVYIGSTTTIQLYEEAAWPTGWASYGLTDFPRPDVGGVSNDFSSISTFDIYIQMVGINSYSDYITSLKNNYFNSPAFINCNTTETANLFTVTDIAGNNYNYILRIEKISNTTLTITVKADVEWPSDTLWTKYGLSGMPRPAGTGNYSLIEGEFFPEDHAYKDLYTSTHQPPSKYPILVNVSGVTASAYRTALEAKFDNNPSYYYASSGSSIYISNVTGTSGDANGNKYILEITLGSTTNIRVIKEADWPDWNSYSSELNLLPRPKGGLSDSSSIASYASASFVGVSNTDEYKTQLQTYFSSKNFVVNDYNNRYIITGIEGTQKYYMIVQYGITTTIHLYREYDWPEAATWTEFGLTGFPTPSGAVSSTATVSSYAIQVSLIGVDDISGYLNTVDSLRSYTDKQTSSNKVYYEYEINDMPYSLEINYNTNNTTMTITVLYEMTSGSGTGWPNSKILEIFGSEDLPQPTELTNLSYEFGDVGYTKALRIDFNASNVSILDPIVLYFNSSGNGSWYDLYGIYWNGSWNRTSDNAYIQMIYRPSTSEGYLVITFYSY